MVKKLLNYKIKINLILVLLLFPIFFYAQLPNTENFESGTGIWNLGGGDSFRENNIPLNNTWGIHLRDNSSSASSIYTNNIDLTTYGSVSISFDFRAQDFNNGEDFFVEISNDGGTTWNSTPLANYVYQTDFENNQNYSKTISIESGLPVPFSTTTNFRIRCDASGNRDHLYVDNIVICPDLSAPTSVSASSSSITLGDSVDLTYIGGSGTTL